MGWGLRIAAGALTVLTAGSGLVFWGALRVMAPGPLEHAETVVIPRGSGLEAIALTLEDAGVVDSPILFLFAAKLQGPLKAGEYAFPAGISVDGVLEMLHQGKTVVRRFTVPEGLTSAQVVALLDAEPALTGELKTVPKNGTVLPETYHYSYGDSRSALIERMQHAMTQALNDAWKNRGPDLPYETPQQALTMASIVEKETGVAAERAKVAGVFVNRLETGMKLQSDPTVIYALTDGSGELGRALTRNDWKFESPYNTYVAAGLPPGPIANPGRASIQAALHPEKHDFLYFVADGTGGHVFAKTLPDHNRNVAKWREVQRRQSGGAGNGDTPQD
ncbi:endolytic transglycosylase MltG [Azospirillum argentinense]|uniref:Endolytic murein transglycosylase n=2 Tax=Azospirillum TaxID=191 RepID=A0A4D8PVF1_AZOBR|nr:endolytic transglycosylase MltG [Azospirillum argentinense]QCN94290.1 endolytic transglycosylase MltG [Azospirillum argentinense]QCO01481.1 endolytic transglycosylase MltG [Azospirillum argentinense]